MGVTSIDELSTRGRARLAAWAVTVSIALIATSARAAPPSSGGVEDPWADPSAPTPPPKTDGAPSAPSDPGGIEDPWSDSSESSAEPTPPTETSPTPATQTTPTEPESAPAEPAASGSTAKEAPNGETSGQSTIFTEGPAQGKSSGAMLGTTVDKELLAKSKRVVAAGSVLSSVGTITVSSSLICSTLGECGLIPVITLASVGSAFAITGLILVFRGIKLKKKAIAAGKPQAMLGPYPVRRGAGFGVSLRF